jgi:anti-anti-sigma factor
MMRFCYAVRSVGGFRSIGSLALFCARRDTRTTETEPAARRVAFLGHLVAYVKVLRLNCRTLGPIPREALADALDAEAGTQVVLDFEGVESISSEGLTALLKMVELGKVRGAFGSLRLRNVHPDIAEVFRITRLDQVFQISGHWSDP